MKYKKEGLFIIIVCLVSLLVVNFGFNDKSIKFEKNFSQRDINTATFWTENNYYTAIERAKLDTKEFGKKINGAIIPHHLLVSDKIANFFENLAKQNPKTIILLGPNHYYSDTKEVITGLNSWDTAEGVLMVDAYKTKQILKMPFVKVDENLITGEHSIVSHLHFISHYMPDTKIVSLVLNNNMTMKEINDLSERIYKSLDDETVLIASVDFSHYLSSETAKIKDEKTILMLKNYDYENIISLKDDHMDSPDSVITLMKSLEKNNINDFDIMYHLNSSDVLEDYQGDVTSYFFLLF